MVRGKPGPRWPWNLSIAPDLAPGAATAVGGCRSRPYRACRCRRGTTDISGRAPLRSGVDRRPVCPGCCRAEMELPCLRFSPDHVSKKLAPEFLSRLGSARQGRYIRSQRQDCISSCHSPLSNRPQLLITISSAARLRGCVLDGGQCACQTSTPRGRAARPERLE